MTSSAVPSDNAYWHDPDEPGWVPVILDPIRIAPIRVVARYRKDDAENPPCAPPACGP